MISAAKPGVTTYETPGDQDVVITRVVNAPRGLVFETWTEPRHLRKWMLGPEGWTMPVCEMDVRPGGRWRYVWRRANGTEIEMSGEIREVARPERLVTTEKWGPQWPETLNTLILTEVGGRTTMTLTIRYPDAAARQAALATGMKDGTEQSYARLESLLAELADVE